MLGSGDRHEHKCDKGGHWPHPTGGRSGTDEMVKKYVQRTFDSGLLDEEDTQVRRARVRVMGRSARCAFSAPYGLYRLAYF